MLYSPPAIEVTGVMNVYPNQIIKMVFFCPIDCPPSMRSPYRVPIFLPMANCMMQQKSEAIPMADMWIKVSLLCIRALQVTAMASAKPMVHR